MDYSYRCPSTHLSSANRLQPLASQVFVALLPGKSPLPSQNTRNPGTGATQWTEESDKWIYSTVENISWSYSWVYFLLQRAMGRYLSRLKRRHGRLRCSPLWSAHQWRVKLGEMGKRQVNIEWWVGQFLLTNSLSHSPCNPCLSNDILSSKNHS